jgi:hypothetical protein
MSSNRDDDDDQYVQQQKVAMNCEICLSKFRGVRLYYLKHRFYYICRVLMVNLVSCLWVCIHFML